MVLRTRETNSSPHGKQYFTPERGRRCCSTVIAISIYSWPFLLAFSLLMGSHFLRQVKAGLPSADNDEYGIATTTLKAPGPPQETQYSLLKAMHQSDLCRQLSSFSNNSTRSQQHQHASPATVLFTTHTWIVQPYRECDTRYAIQVQSKKCHPWITDLLHCAVLSQPLLSISRPSGYQSPGPVDLPNYGRRFYHRQTVANMGRVLGLGRIRHCRNRLRGEPKQLRKRVVPNRMIPQQRRDF